MQPSTFSDPQDLLAHSVDRDHARRLAEDAQRLTRPAGRGGLVLAIVVSVLSLVGLALAMASILAQFRHEAGLADPSSQILGVAVVAAAVIVGYFVILREWLTGRRDTALFAQAALSEAQESQRWVERERERLAARARDGATGSGD